MFISILNKIVNFFTIPVAIYSVQRYSSLPIGNTFVWWLINGIILFAFLGMARYTVVASDNKKSLLVVKIYLLWVLFCIIRGALVMAESYWHYKSLVSMGMALLAPIFVYIALNENKVQQILSIYVRYALPLTILVFPFLNVGAWGWYLFPISFLFMFLPILSFKDKLILLTIILIVIIGGISVRSYIFKFGIPIVLLVFYYFRNVPKLVMVMESLRKVIILLPFLFFFLAASGVFNVFNMSEYMGEDVAFGRTTASHRGNTYESRITDDSRTFLYLEVIASAVKYDYWLLGRSPARGNETVWFAKEMIEDVGEPERIRNEAGILNTFTWTGVIGVFLLFLVFYKSSYIAVNNSNNIYVKMIGLFVALRWVYSWVEDYQEFDLNAITIWLMIGICFSKSFREMSNSEVKLWVKAVFDRRYLFEYKRHVYRSASAN